MKILVPPLVSDFHAIIFFRLDLASRWETGYGVPWLDVSEDGTKRVLVTRGLNDEVWGEGRTWDAACTQAMNASRPIRSNLRTCRSRPQLALT